VPVKDDVLSVTLRGLAGLTIVMRQNIEQRLAGLKSEYEKGQTQFRQLETQLTSMRETLTRISGAVMVLEEVLASPIEERRSADLSSGEKPAVQVG